MKWETILASCRSIFIFLIILLLQKCDRFEWPLLHYIWSFTCASSKRDVISLKKIWKERDGNYPLTAANRREQANWNFVEIWEDFGSWACLAWIGPPQPVEGTQPGMWSGHAGPRPSQTGHGMARPRCGWAGSFWHRPVFIPTTINAVCLTKDGGARDTIRKYAHICFCAFFH